MSAPRGRRGGETPAESIPAESGASVPANRAPHRGRSALPRRTRRFDAIVNDTFSGKEPVRTLATVEVARAVKGCLASDGVYAMNVVSRDDGPGLTLLRDETATLA